MNKHTQATISAQDAVKRVSEGLWGLRGAIRLSDLGDAVQSAEDGEVLVLYTNRIPTPQDLVDSLLDFIDEQATEDSDWDFTAHYVGDEPEGTHLRYSEAFTSLITEACAVAVQEAQGRHTGTHYETSTQVVVTQELRQMLEEAR